MIPAHSSTPAPAAAAASGRLSIHVRDVTKTFGQGDSRTVALKGADFEAREGELHLVIGPSGCGKTTLLSVIAGTLAWDSGEIEVLGTNLRSLSTGATTEFRRKNIGFIFQQFNLIPTLSCMENVSVPMLLNGGSRREAEDRAARLLNEVGLGNKLHQRPSQLSGGQQQRVAIARALIHDPRLLICDEPTSALDSTTGHQIMDLLASVSRGPGRSVIIVTHDPRVYSYADCITEMEDGRVRRVLTGESIKNLRH